MATAPRMNQAQDFVEQSFRQASDSFSRTMEAGIRLQEDAVKYWSEMAGRNVEELRTQWHKAAGNVPFDRENLDRLTQILEEQSTKNMDLLREAMDIGRSRNPGEIYDRMLSLWRSSFDSVRNSADSLARINADIFEAWTHMAREAGEQMTGNVRGETRNTRGTSRTETDAHAHVGGHASSHTNNGGPVRSGATATRSRTTGTKTRK